MKVAIITQGEPTNIKGIMNFVHEKTSRMQQQQNDGFTVDLFMIRHRYSWLYALVFRLLKGWNGKTYRNDESDCFIKNGVVINNLWVKKGLLDFIIDNKIAYRPIGKRYVRLLGERLSDYDVLATHKLESHYLGLKLKEAYGKPLVATWHGTDIHTAPFQNDKLRKITKLIIEYASMNYFVSRNLLEISDNITTGGVKDVIYTGASAIFYRYEDTRRQQTRQQNAVEACSVVAYVGNLIPVKNVLSLPKIFELIHSKIKKDQLIFWVIGDGVQRMELEHRFKRMNVSVRMFGNVQPSSMPDLMNCIDVLVVPSFNEGFPLVAVEARACGANVVASNVGGIPEAVGQIENCFSFDEDFEERVSNRVVEILSKCESPKPLSPEFSWDAAINKELKLYGRLLLERK